MIKKLLWLKPVIVDLRFRLHQEEGSRANFLHRRLEVDLIDLYMYQNIVEPRKSVIKAGVQAPIQLEQAVEVEQLNLMINARLQKNSSKAKNQIERSISQTYIIQRKKKKRETEQCELEGKILLLILKF